MNKNTFLRAIVLLTVLALPVATQSAETDTSTPASGGQAPPSDPAQLRDLVAELDRKMFDAYNAHDVDGLMAMFDADLEFYHDTGGLLSFDQVWAGFTNVFANNKDIRRDLVPGSLEVYPIKDYGAIQIGAHKFCHTENGAPDCGTFRFVQIWRFKDGVWKVTRDVSYGH